jgi:hypothetical protein
VHKHFRLSLPPSYVSLADGNPDEKKIGAFGVGGSKDYIQTIGSLTRGVHRLLQLVLDNRGAMGHLRRYADVTLLNPPRFYSYISGKWMNFYWRDKKDQVSHFYTLYLNIMLTKISQLYVRRGTVGDAVDAWTTFQMTLREPGPMPPAFDFTRFLVSSIAFMTHLSEVSVYFDDKRLVKLSKNRGVSKEVPMLKELKGMSPEGMMNVESIETTREFKFCCCSSGRIYLYFI